MSYTPKNRIAVSKGVKENEVEIKKIIKKRSMKPKAGSLKR